MDHRLIQEQLFAFYDGELIGLARRAVEAHLLDCADCRTVVSQWTQVTRVAFQAPAVSASEVFVQRVMQRIETPRPQSLRLSRWFFNSRWLIPAMGLAAMVIVMISGPLRQTVSIESLLLSDGREPAALQRVLSGESPSGDDILGLLMEDAS